MKKCLDIATQTLDAQVHSEQEEARLRHEERQRDLTTIANTAINTWTMAGANGQSPPAHVNLAFVPTAPQKADYAARLHVLQNQATFPV